MIINAAIQIIPLNVTDGYALVDRAIAHIQASGLPFQVGPFSTSVEGTYPEITALVERIKASLLGPDLGEVLINLQLHCKAGGDVRAIDKTGKFSQAD